MDKELQSLIDRYFQGETTLEEEMRLRRMLLETTSDNPRILETLAVFSYTDMKAGVKKRKRHRSWKNFAAAAVIASILLTIGVTVYNFSGSRVSVCSTMIACKESDNEELAINLMLTQLEAVGEASVNVDNDIRSDLNKIGEFVIN